MEDNFFDLGGDSLSAIRATVRMRDALGVELPLRSLYENPTLSEVLKNIECIVHLMSLKFDDENAIDSIVNSLSDAEVQLYLDKLRN